jgi:hypothetical protein
MKRDIQHNDTQHNSKQLLCWVSHKRFMLNVVMLNVVILNVVMLRVEAPFLA